MRSFSYCINHTSVLHLFFVQLPEADKHILLYHYFHSVQVKNGEYSENSHKDLQKLNIQNVSART